MVWALLLILACTDHPEGVSPGHRVPEQAGLPELGQGALEGRATVIFFWTSWSGAARREAPGLAPWRDEARVLAVNLEGDPALVAHAESTWLAGVEHLRDRTGRAREVWEIEAVPTVVFVDAEGIVRARGTVLPSPAAFTWEAP